MIENLTGTQKIHFQDRPIEPLRISDLLGPLPRHLEQRASVPHLGHSPSTSSTSAEPLLGKIRNGTEFRILVQQSRPHLQGSGSNPGVCKREGVTGFDPGGLLQ